MFIRLSNSEVISLIGKALDIIRLPDKDDNGIIMNFALVVVHNTADPPSPAGSAEDGYNTDYWDKFTIIAECETHDAGEIRLGQPLHPLMDKICNTIESGYHFLDLRDEKLYITFQEVQEMSTKAELDK